MTAGFAGKFIVFDGPDGSGKTTQLDRLASVLGAKGLTVVRCKDPGGTSIGDRIRHILLDYDLTEMDVRCETLLFMASRAQLVSERVAPALKRGHVVLCDRFVSATCAYQAAAGFEVQQILDLARHAIGTTWPDLTVVLDLNVEAGFQRTGRSLQNTRRNKGAGGQRSMFDGVTTDAMEARPMDFHRRVRELFLALPLVYPRPVHIIPADGTPEEVHQSLLEILGKCFGVGPERSKC